MRIITTTGCHRGPATGFAATTQGSHHIHLQSQINTLFNILADRERTWGGPGLPARPVLQQVGSGESFGLVVSNHNLTFGGLLQIKDEPDKDQKLEGLINDREEEIDVAMVLRDLNIDPALLNQPKSGHDIPYQSTIHPSSSSPPSLLALLNSTPPSSSAASSGLSTFDTVIYSLTADSSRDNPEDGTPGRLKMKVPVSNVVIVSAAINFPMIGLLIKPIRCTVGLDSRVRGGHLFEKKANGS